MLNMSGFSSADLTDYKQKEEGPTKNNASQIQENILMRVRFNRYLSNDTVELIAQSYPHLQ